MKVSGSGRRRCCGSDAMRANVDFPWEGARRRRREGVLKLKAAGRVNE